MISLNILFSRTNSRLLCMDGSLSYQLMRGCTFSWFKYSLYAKVLIGGLTGVCARPHQLYIAKYVLWLASEKNFMFGMVHLDIFWWYAVNFLTYQFPVSRTGKIKFPVREREGKMGRENGKTGNPVSRNAIPTHKSLLKTFVRPREEDCESLRLVLRATNGLQTSPKVIFLPSLKLCIAFF